jgi:hypothetical protein
MRLMLLALYVAAAAIPAVILSLLLLKMMPHIPLPVLMLINLLVIVGGTVLYRRSRISFYTTSGEPEKIPSWMQNKALIPFLVIGSLIGSAAIYMSNKADLYIDNGTDRVVKIDLKHEGSFDVPAHSYVKKTVVIGSDNEIKYEGKTRPLNIAKDGNWLFNIDTANTYVRTSVIYQSTSIFSKNETRDSSMPDFKLVTGEFFDAEADFMFDAPDKIKGERGKSGPVTKTVLLRIPHEDITENETDTTQHGE